MPSDWTVTGPTRRPLTVSWVEFKSVWPSPSRYIQLERKKNTAVYRHPQTHSFWVLAGILPSIYRKRVRRSTSASAVPVPFVLSLVVFGIEFFKTVRAYAVTEFRLGVGLNVNFHGLPLATLILNFVARRTGG